MKKVETDDIRRDFNPRDLGQILASGQSKIVLKSETYFISNTILSTRPKHEIACGLVLSNTQLTGITDNTALHPIAGENYYLEYIDDDDNQFKGNQEWRSPFDLEGNITKLEIPKLDNLEQFLYEFHQGLRLLNIQSIKPLAPFP